MLPSGNITKSVNRVTIDFEIVVRNAFLQWNENILIRLCFFHLGENVWRHVQSAGKVSEYNNNLEFREHIRMMLCTAFLPVKDVIAALKDCSQLVQRTVSQFSSTLKTITSADTTLPDRDRNRDLQLND